MVQIAEIKHVDTERLTDDLRKIGLAVKELSVKVSVDGLTEVKIEAVVVDRPMSGIPVTDWVVSK